MRYNVKEQGENERNRLARILDFQGPDHDTLMVLDRNFDNWSACPESFWIRPAHHDDLNSIQPQAHIVGLYIQTQCDDA